MWQYKLLPIHAYEGSFWFSDLRNMTQYQLLRLCGVGQETVGQIWMRSRERCGRKWSWTILRCNLSICMRRTEENHKKSQPIFRPGAPSNVSHIYNHCDNLFRLSSFSYYKHLHILMIIIIWCHRHTMNGHILFWSIEWTTHAWEKEVCSEICYKQDTKSLDILLQ